MQETIRRFCGSGLKTWSIWIFGVDGDFHWPFYYWTSYQRTATGKLEARLWTKIRAIVRHPEVIQTMLWRYFEDCWKRTILHYIWWRRRVGRNEEFMSRVHVFLKWRRMTIERMHSRKYEDRIGLGGADLLLSKTFRYWNMEDIVEEFKKKFEEAS